MRYCIFCGLSVGDELPQLSNPKRMQEKAHMAIAHRFAPVRTFTVNDKLVQEGPWVYVGPDTLEFTFGEVWERLDELRGLQRSKPAVGERGSVLLEYAGHRIVHNPTEGKDG